MTQSNPLITGIIMAQEQISAYTSHARAFYYDILLETHPCPQCGGRLKVTGPSACVCTSCGGHSSVSVTERHYAGLQAYDPEIDSF